MLAVVLSCAPDAEDPPCETEGYGVESCCVSNANFLLRFQLGMAKDTGPLQYASHSWSIRRVSVDCSSQRTIDSFVSAASTVCVFPSSMQSVCRGLSVAADVAPVHQEHSELPQPAHHSCVKRDFDVPMQLSVFWRDQPRVPLCVR